MSQVKVTVSGSNFVFDRDILNRQPLQKLPQLVTESVKLNKPLEFTFDRPAVTFTYILGYYQTGQLHMPTCVCPGFFKQELDYWGIDPGELDECCYYRYTKFQNDLDTQRKFKKKTIATRNAALPMVAVMSPDSLASFRYRLWRMVDSNTSTLAAKIYFGLVMFMVLLSVCTLAFSTEPSMRRALNKCELLEYLKYTSHPNREFIRKTLNYPSCSGNVRTSNTEKVETYEYDWEALWYYYYSDGEYGDYVETTTQPPKSTNTVRSTTSIQEDGDTAIQNSLRNDTNRRNIKIPHLTVPHYAFDVLEWITMAFFSIDLMLRLFSCPSVKKYFLSFLNIIDASALVCSYVYVVVLSIKKEYRYESSWIRVIEFLQIFRVMRLFRVVQNVRATKVLAYSMWQNLRDITLLGFLLFMTVALFSTLLYFTEDSDNVESIPQAWYWAVITLTTVGYGDISPKTYPGRVVAAVCAVVGIILLAVTLPIFVNNFLVLYEFSCLEEANESRRSKECSRRYSHEISIDDISTTSTRGSPKTHIFIVTPKPSDADITKEAQ